MQSGEFPRPPMELCYFRCKASVVNKRVCHLTLKITYNTIIVRIMVLSSLFFIFFLMQGTFLLDKSDIGCIIVIGTSGRPLYTP